MAENGEVIIGIDLGTTNTCISRAYRYQNKIAYEAIENGLGAKTTPSIVSFLPDEFVVGQVAKNQLPNNPENTVYGAKRLIGHKRSESEINKLFQYAKFQITADADDNPKIRVKQGDEYRELYPEQISALVLGECKNIVKAKTGRYPDKCIITVPAYFNELQRTATMKAAKIAGLNVLKLVNEPTAAAIAFQDKFHFTKGTILVYDFGGGTLDVSILEVNENKYMVKAVAGDTAFGGEDIDALLLEEMLRRFKKKNPGVDPSKDSRAIARLKLQCEEMKKQLSTNITSRIYIDKFYNGRDLDETIQRATFESLCDDLFEKITDVIDSAITDAGLSPDDITHLILVGGSSAIPYVSQTISEFFDERLKPLQGAVNPDEAIAIGASILCQKMATGKAFNDETEKKVTSEIVQSTPKASVKASSIAVDMSSCSDESSDSESDDDDYIEIVDVQSCSIGIQSGKTRFQKFIKRNLPLPQEASFKFRTTKDNQTTAKIVVLIGEEPEINFEEKTHVILQQFNFSGLPPRPQGEVMLNITLRVDTSGLLTVSPQCIANGISESFSINTSSFLEDDAMQDAIKLQQKLMDQNEYKNLLKTLQFQIEKCRSNDPTRACGWTLQYNYFSELDLSSPKLRENLERLRQTVDKIKEENSHY